MHPFFSFDNATVSPIWYADKQIAHSNASTLTLILLLPGGIGSLTEVFNLPPSFLFNNFFK
jgi:hypothetical protein